MSAGPWILIVDDSEDDVLFMSQILDQYGYSHSVARNDPRPWTRCVRIHRTWSF